MLRDQLRELLAPALAAVVYQLWELEFNPRSVGGLLRIYIDARGDSPNSISLDDCERVSRVVSETLDAADPIPSHYTLEVSSPGLDRVLRTREHFERFAGERVRLEMMQPVEGRKRFAGRLLGVGTSDITLELENGRINLPIEDIHRARLAPDM